MVMGKTILVSLPVSLSQLHAMLRNTRYYQHYWATRSRRQGVVAGTRATTDETEVPSKGFGNVPMVPMY